MKSKIMGKILDEDENKRELTIEILEEFAYIPFLSIINKSVKYCYYKNMRNKLTTFLNYATEEDKFFEEIDKKPDLLNYLSDYFESIRTTPSFLAIKTMALIFREHQVDKKIQQRTCRAFAEITDYELDLFILLYEETKKLQTKEIDISKSKTYLKEIKNDELKYCLNNLTNRGFLFMSVNTGFIDYNTDTNFNFIIKFDLISEFYYKYILSAKKLKDVYLESNK